MGLGSAASVPLADAREKAASARRKIAHGLNPIDERKRDGGSPLLARWPMTCGKRFLPVSETRSTRLNGRSTLETYAAPLRSKPVDTIHTDDVLAVLKPIWTTKAETASRLRGRIEKVLDAAKAKGFRDGREPCSMARAFGPPVAQASQDQPGAIMRRCPMRKCRRSSRNFARATPLPRRLSKFAFSRRRGRAKFWACDGMKSIWTRNLWTIPANRMKGGP